MLYLSQVISIFKGISAMAVFIFLIIKIYFNTATDLEQVCISGAMTSRAAYLFLISDSYAEDQLNN